MKEDKKIENPEHYFNKLISCEIRNDKKKFEKIRENECSLDEKLAKGQIPPCIICNQYNEQFENIIFDKDNLTWLESIENERLYFALKQLKTAQLNLIYLSLIKGCTQREIAAELNVNHKTVSINIKRAIKKILKTYPKNT